MLLIKPMKILQSPQLYRICKFWHSRSVGNERSTCGAQIKEISNLYETRKAGEPNLTENAVEQFEIGKIRYLKKGRDFGLTFMEQFLIIVMN